VDIWIVWIDKVGIILKKKYLRRPFENCEFTPLPKQKQTILFANQRHP